MPEEINENGGRDRDFACAANREHLWRHRNPDLRPKNYAGVEDCEAYLEHDRHADEIVSFFMEWFEGVKKREIPHGGIVLTVYSRYDALEGYVLRLRICGGREGAERGAPLEFALFNWTGGGCTGYHYDPLFRICLLYTSPSPRDVEESRMPSSA